MVTELTVPSPSRTFPLLFTTWLKTTEPPAEIWPLLLGEIVSVRTVFTETASCNRSLAPVVGDKARK